MLREYDLSPSRSEWWGGIKVRIDNDARKCVVFFGFSKQGEDDETYLGTGFFVEYPGDNNGPQTTYLVTAAHVARQFGSIGFIIRINTKDGGSLKIEPEEIDWTFHRDKNVDVAVTEFQVPAECDVKSVPAQFFVNEEVRKKTNNIGGGSMAHIVGLFRLHHGENRNLPIVHTGNVALVPDDVEKIPVRDPITGIVSDVVGYLVEAQTLDGLSGSPVFARRRIDITPDAAPRLVYSRVFLLGVWQGSWAEDPSQILVSDVTRRGNVRVPVGMGVVVPADRIMEILEMPKFVKKRDKVRKISKEQNAATLDSALPTTGENPQHREDFNRLLDAAVPGNKSDR